ncbi:MAG: hypothetical protein JWN41_1554 [Thermoleophilia bacterium]|nr:hypothetical protein [Thermoleophilia bacterium]
MDIIQQQRIARNEATFRETNERVTHAMSDVRGYALEGDFTVICECAILECVDMVVLTLEQYQKVRVDHRWFAVRPHHVTPGAERVVSEGAGYWIVEKTGAAAVIAQQMGTADALLYADKPLLTLVRPEL